MTKSEEKQEKIEETQEKTEKQLSETEKKEQRITELTETLQRLQAEFENYKKRCNAEMTSCIKLSSKDIIIKLLPIADNFELALNNTENKEEFVKGVELIYSQLISILEAEGIKKIDTEQKEFNPQFHEALLQDNDQDTKDNLITEELQKGYMLNNEVIRHSKVKVNKNDNKRNS